MNGYQILIAVLIVTCFILTFVIKQCDKKIERMNKELAELKLKKGDTVATPLTEED